MKPPADIPCSKCGLIERANGKSWCKICFEAYAKEYRSRPRAKQASFEYRKSDKFKASVKKYRQSKRGREVIRAHNVRRHLKDKYGLSLEERDVLLREQQFKCASCGNDLHADKPRGTHIDHCHQSGIVRGILCADCNVSLGRMRENPERIRKLAEYAERMKIP